MTFDLRDIKELHIEPSSRCNAACPQCGRYTNGGEILNPEITIKDLKLETIKEKCSVDFVKQLNKMYMCGTYGDPAAHRDPLAIYEWFREINPTITLGMNTNGGLRNSKFWSKLGIMLSRERDYCVFSIDGLSDTNHLYRRNVNFNKVIVNVKEFIAAGGRAHWDMLVFKHNEHQVDDCMRLAKKLGFVAFRAKVSKRFIIRPVIGLEPPEIYRPDLQYGNVSCAALNERSVYLNYRGELLPCCFLSSSKYKLEDFPNIINNWTQTCIKSCSTVNDRSNFGKQWFREEYFK